MKYEKYSPDWKDIIRPQILKRDSYKCVVCGVGHKKRVYKKSDGLYMECDEFVERWAIDSGKKVFTLFLQVAHLDHNKSNNDPSNLRTLCPVHHGRHDKQHKQFMRISYRTDMNKKEIEYNNKIFDFVHKETGKRLSPRSIKALVKIVLNQEK